jgi:predicted DCC family thiol-disulfide oxidoreductase YuxK
MKTAPSITVLFDGNCPLCSREIRFLDRLDRGRGRIGFEDIASSGFDPAPYGRSQADLMARIHGALPDGTLIEGMEVFRRAYAAVGLGWILAPTAWPGVRPLADAGYRWFARNRLRLTGRSHACELPSSGVRTGITEGP